MKTRIAALMCACAAVALVTGCADYEKPALKRPIAQPAAAAAAPAPKLTPEQQAKAELDDRCWRRRTMSQLSMLKDEETREQWRINNAECSQVHKYDYVQ